MAGANFGADVRNLTVVVDGRECRDAELKQPHRKLRCSVVPGSGTRPLAIVVGGQRVLGSVVYAGERTPPLVVGLCCG